MIGISSKTVYAVAALQELGDIQDDSVLKIKEIAANANIPQNFLEQILLELKKQGLLTST
ncbi:MAG TPA: transcriptional regulator, partial [Epsilonproteobacteria bacterium]|nr:transcriptional regulator [Campylobacterota bacterium]